MENAGLFVSRGEGMHPTRSISSYELIFVQSGVLKMFEGKQQFILPRHSYLILHPGRLHGGTETYPPDLSFYWIHFRIPKKDLKGNAKLLIPQTGIAHQPERIIELYRQFLADQESKNQTPARSALQMLSILELISCGKTRSAPEASALITRAKQLIVQEAHTGIRTSDIAKRLHCNPDYLGRSYKQYNRSTITEALLNQRIKLAQGHLMDSTMNITEIAMHCGFEDPKYFRKNFKRIKGMTPSAYRHQYSRVHYNTA